MAPYLREMDGIAEKASEFLAGVEKSDNDDEATIDEKDISVVEDRNSIQNRLKKTMEGSGYGIS